MPTNGRTDFDVQSRFARVCWFASDGRCVYVTLCTFDATQDRRPEGSGRSDTSIMRGRLLAAGRAGSAIDLRINNIVYGVSKNDGSKRLGERKQYVLTYSETAKNDVSSDD